MYKFFLPIIVILVAIWIIIGLQQQEESVNTNIDNEVNLTESVEGFELKEILFNHKSIMIPAFMDTTSDLHDYAEIQFQSLNDELYLIAISESKDSSDIYSLEEYFKIVADYFINDVLTDGKSNGPLLKEINGMNSAQGYITGNFSTDGGVFNIYYRLGIYETEGYYYQVLTWTIGENRDKFEEVMNAMLSSFKEQK
ncbi:MAG TPA: hypothetical protein DDX39_06915 [Bacteroidales bacterium]|nr:MAG: hypothetical protein A2W98_14990 [Bacteroidetes bacterium GWF2_33_38]OFY73947.1 MAG: hypothetical protein A2265_08510 [Bacteroidetes bacterium RIFOXYA12_FULL_33_9]HBF88359.1 hypothetical protein [Bacteroidales bacterium]